MRPVRAGLTGLSLLAGGLGVAAAGDICEPLRERIEAQIGATGALSYAVIVVNADAPVAGKVVGTCAKGTRKLVYVRGDDRGSPAPAASQAARPRQESPVRRIREADVITECRDGTVLRGDGGCPS